MTWRSSAFVVTGGVTGWVSIYPVVIVTPRTVGSAEILIISSTSGVVGIGISSRTPRIGRTCKATIISVTVIPSIAMAVWRTKIGIAIIPISKTIIGIEKAQPPIGSIKPSVEEERTVIPKGIIKEIVKTPIEIKISPRVVVDIIDFCSAGAISPRSLRVYTYITVAIVTAVVISIGVDIVLRIIQ